MKTHILCSITFFPKNVFLLENVEIYGTARQATDDNIIQRMHLACWLTKAIDTHIIFNTYSFPRQEWLRERTSMLRSAYIASCVY